MLALRRPFLSLAAVALASAGCARPLGQADGGGVAGAGGRGSPLGTAGTSPIPPNCGGRSAFAVHTAPTFLLVVDRSESMRRDFAGSDCGGDCGPSAKWAAVTGAIGDALAVSPTNVGWGLLVYPWNGQATCNPGVSSELDVPLGRANAPAIVAALAGQSPGGARPTARALSAAAACLDATTDPKPAYLVLITDGRPECQDGDGSAEDDLPVTVATIASARGAGISTVVVGVGTPSNPAVNTALTMLARAGGIQSAPASGTDRAGLAARLDGIVRTATSCAFALPPPPTDDGVTSRSFIDVAVGQMRIPRDVTRVDGWDYLDRDYEYIQVFGPVCESAQAGTLGELTVSFRCTGG